MMRYRTTREEGLPASAVIAAGGLLGVAASQLLAAYERHYERTHRTHRITRSMQRMMPRDMRDMDPRAHPGAAVAAVAAVGLGAWLLSSSMRSGPGRTHTVQEYIDLDVPVHTAYNQWTQFESFPQFMATVESVRQIDDTHLHWRAVVGGKTKEWDAKITEQIPDERIAWRSISGVPNAGVVTFHRLGENRTRVTLQMEYTPESRTEKLGDAVGGTRLTLKGNLKKFKQLLESRGQETGAWRGTVAQQH